MKNMTLNEGKKTKPFIFFMSFMVKNNLLLRLYFQLSRLKFVAKTFVKINLLFFLAMCLVLPNCGGRGIGNPIVFTDAEEYTTDGIEAYVNTEWGQAQHFFSKALQLYQGIDHQEGVLLSYINLAEVSLALHNYAESNLYLVRAESIAKDESLQYYRSRIVLLSSLIVLQQNQLTEAEQILQEILPEFEGTALYSVPNDIQLAAIASRTKVAFLKKHGELLWTRRYENALNKAANKSTVREAHLLRFQSSLLLQQKADSDAESKLQQALILYKSNLSRTGIAATLLELAQYNREKQRWQKALDYFNRSKAVYTYLGDDEKVKLISRMIEQLQNNING